ATNLSYASVTSCIANCKRSRMSANGMVRPCSWPLSARRLAGGTKRKEHAMSGKHNSVIAAIGIDIGKNWFHVVGLDGRGAIALRQKWSRGQVEARLANREEELQESFPGRVRGMDIDHQMIVGLRKEVEAVTAVLEGLSSAHGRRGLAAADVS